MAETVINLDDDLEGLGEAVARTQGEIDRFAEAVKAAQEAFAAARTGSPPGTLT